MNEDERRKLAHTILASECFPTGFGFRGADNTLPGAPAFTGQLLHILLDECEAVHLVSNPDEGNVVCVWEDDDAWNGYATHGASEFSGEDMWEALARAVAWMWGHKTKGA